MNTSNLVVYAKDWDLHSLKFQTTITIFNVLMFPESTWTQVNLLNIKYKHLLCIRHCSGIWGQNNDPNWQTLFSKKFSKVKKKYNKLKIVIYTVY